MTPKLAVAQARYRGENGEDISRHRPGTKPWKVVRPRHKWDSRSSTLAQYGQLLVPGNTGREKKTHVRQRSEAFIWNTGVLGWARAGLNAPSFPRSDCKHAAGAYVVGLVLGGDQDEDIAALPHELRARTRVSRGIL